MAAAEPVPDEPVAGAAEDAVEEPPEPAAVALAPERLERERAVPGAVVPERGELLLRDGEVDPELADLGHDLRERRRGHEAGARGRDGGRDPRLPRRAEGGQQQRHDRDREQQREQRQPTGAAGGLRAAPAGTRTASLGGRRRHAADRIGGFHEVQLGYGAGDCDRLFRGAQADIVPEFVTVEREAAVLPERPLPAPGGAERDDGRETLLRDAAACADPDPAVDPAGRACRSCCSSPGRWPARCVTRSSSSSSPASSRCCSTRSCGASRGAGGSASPAASRSRSCTWRSRLSSQSASSPSLRCSSTGPPRRWTGSTPTLRARTDRPATPAPRTTSTASRGGSTTTASSGSRSRRACRAGSTSSARTT